MNPQPTKDLSCLVSSQNSHQYFSRWRFFLISRSWNRWCTMRTDMDYFGGVCLKCFNKISKLRMNKILLVKSLYKSIKTPVVNWTRSCEPHKIKSRSLWSTTPGVLWRCGVMDPFISLLSKCEIIHTILSTQNVYSVDIIPHYRHLYLSIFMKDSDWNAFYSCYSSTLKLKNIWRVITNTWHLFTYRHTYKNTHASCNKPLDKEQQKVASSRVQVTVYKG